MPAPYAWNQPWLDANAQRAYPLAESSTRVDESGSFRLPDSFLVELALAVPATLEVDPSRFFLYKIVVGGGGYAVSLAYDGGDGPTIVASTSFSRTSVAAGMTPLRLIGLGPFSDCTGRLMVGRVGDVDAGPAGQFQFSAAGGRLDPDCVRPQLRGVSRIAVGETVALGDFTLVPGRNVQFRVLADDGENVRIAIDALDATNFNEDCPGQKDLSPPIRTINGRHAINGNFDIKPGACVGLTSAEGELALSNTCSQPCCGCRELDGLKQELKALEQQVDAVASRVDLMAMQQGWTSQMLTNWAPKVYPGDFR